MREAAKDYEDRYHGYNRNDREQTLAKVIAAHAPAPSVPAQTAPPVKFNDCGWCGRKESNRIHKKGSLGYHRFLPRCPKCGSNTPMTRWFVPLDGVKINSGEIYTPQNSKACDDSFHPA